MIQYSLGLVMKVEAAVLLGMAAILTGIFLSRVGVDGDLLVKENVANSYIIQDSRRYAAYAAVAFCPKNCVQSWTCGTTNKYSRLVDVTYIQNNVTKALSYIGYNPQTQQIIISWRGSSNTQNWIEDFNFQMEPYIHCKGCFVHTGFMADYRLNERKLMTAFKNIMAKSRVSKVICTGHSLGAALSTIAGMQIARVYSNLPVYVHNFGSPRLGNEKLALFIKEKVKEVFRVVHNKDVVPHLPPEVQYKHTPTEVFFDATMTTYKICDSTGEDKSCSNKFFPSYDPDDHDFYFEHISQVRCC